MASNKNEANDKKTIKKTKSSDALNQWMGTLSKAVDKAITAMPGITKKVTEEAHKVSAQIQQNPAFKDIKQKLIETGKQAGDKLGLSGQTTAHSEKKQATNKKPPSKTKASPKSQPVKKKKKEPKTKDS